MTRKKIGLVLGSGAARGLAHVGVLRVLKDEGISIDIIAGSSIGAIVGGVYALRKNITRIEEIAANLDINRLLTFVDIALPNNGLINGRKLAAWGKALIGSDVQFSALEIPFACVATDIMTGQEVVLNEGSVIEAFRASACIPGLFSVAKYKGRFLVDGALINPMPINIAKNMGAEYIGCHDAILIHRSPPAGADFPEKRGRRHRTARSPHRPR